MKTDYLRRLSEGVLLFDGAMGTMLYEKGIFINRCFEEACLTNPEFVSEIHKSYIDAGAQAITTNSFGANTVKLSEYGLADRVREINRAAVQLAREAAGDDIYVAGSIGPLGQRMEPIGKLKRAAAEKAFLSQAGALLEGGVDIILLETFKDVEELLFAAETISRKWPEIPLQAQFSIGPIGLDEYRREVPPIVRRLSAMEGVDVVGANCAVGPAETLEILMAMRGETGKPISVMPNAGFPREVDGRQIYLASPDYFSEYAKRYLEAGASVIGGCCGTTYEHIRKMARAVLNLDSGSRRIEIPRACEEAEPSEPMSLCARSGLGQALAEGRWITTIELVPPLGSDLSGITAKAAELKKGGITCVNIPDGPRASSRISALVTAFEIQRVSGVETILHVCCRDMNLIAVQAQLLGAQELGLRNMLFITGDPPKVGNYPDVTGVFDVDSIGLLSLASRLNRGIDLGGNPISAPTSFVVGAGINPVSPVLDREIERARKKAEAGAEFFISQPVFDAEQLLSFIEKIKDTGVPVIAGIWPFASYRNALFLSNEVPGVVIPRDVMARMKRHETREGAREEGIIIAREIVEQVRGSVRGIQVSPPFGKTKTALDVIG